MENKEIIKTLFEQIKKTYKNPTSLYFEFLSCVKRDGIIATKKDFLQIAKLLNYKSSWSGFRYKDYLESCGSTKIISNKEFFEKDIKVKELSCENYTPYIAYPKKNPYKVIGINKRVYYNKPTKK